MQITDNPKQIIETCDWVLEEINLLIEPKTKKQSGQATKGLRRIPRHTEAMKDVVTDETSRGAGSRLRSENLRMGQPLILLPESIG